MDNVSYYRPMIAGAAARVGLDADLVEAVVWQESSYQTSAYRFEPGFWRTYLAANAKYAGQLPERASASYGLMQVMYPVAQEHGYTADPEMLCVPAVGLEFGCAHLASLMKWAGQYRPVPASAANAKLMPKYATAEIRAALAAYNGGKRGNEPDDQPDRNHAYADSVIKKLETILFRERTQQ
jgi:soluble lytic murein transglycosylase-like protein